MRHFRQIILLSISMILSLSITAQKIKQQAKCATMNRLEKLFERNPQLKTRFEQQRDEFNKAVEQDSYQLSRLAETIYYIPVVFHVVSTNPAAITDAQIQAQLDVLNNDFAGMNADSVNIPSHFKSLFGKSSIQFCLAQHNPDGEFSTGVERIITAKTSFNYLTDEMKYSSSGGADSWAPEKYFNIWICALSDEILGYATFPEDGFENAQGVVVDYRSLPGGSYTGYNTGKTLSHETGHYFNLYHIWGDDDGACSGTDYVPDTPNQADASSGCYTGVKTDNCTSSGNGIMYQNYMDYSSDKCLIMFTIMQVTRMETALLAYRSSLLNSDGCEAGIQRSFDAKLLSVNTPEGRICEVSFAPEISIKNMGTQTLTSLTIHYGIDEINLDAYIWTGSLALYATTDIILPDISAKEGSQRLKVFITDPNSTQDENTGNDTLYKDFNYFAALTTVEQGFENNSFPSDQWDIVNTDNDITWERTTSVGRAGTASVMIKNFDYNAIGQRDYLRLPVLNIADKDSAFLSFYIAAGTYTATGTSGIAWDTLEVLVSKDCGASYTSLYKKYGSSLVTRATPTTNAFFPSSAEWRKDSINLAEYIDDGDFMIAFRNTTGYENNIFLDDINLRTVSVNKNLKEQGVMITPNPTSGTIQVQFYPQPDKLKAIQIFSTAEQKIMETNIVVGQANNSYSYDLSRYAAGIYIVRAVFTDNIVVRKIMKN